MALVCVIEGCQKKATHGNYCLEHYNSLRKVSRPAMGRMMTRDTGLPSEARRSPPKSATATGRATKGAAVNKPAVKKSGGPRKS
jgi:hypothetical protein